MDSHPEASQNPTPKPELWNPNIAAILSGILTPIFGSYILAQNWKVLGQQDRVDANKKWMVGFVVLAVVNLVASFTALPKAWELFLRVAAFGLLFRWYFVEGQAQISYMKDVLADQYREKSLLRPGLIALVGVALYVTALFGLFSSDPSASEIAANLKPSIVEDLSQSYPDKSIVISQMTITKTSGGVYTGTVEIQLGDDAQNYNIKATVDGDQLAWEIKPLLGDRRTFNQGQLFFQSPVTQSEVQALGQFLVKEAYFDGVEKVAQIRKVNEIYEFRMPVKAGLDQDPQFAGFAVQMSQLLSQNVFNGQPVHVHFCDGQMLTLKVIGR